MKTLLLTIQQAAHMLKVNPMTLRRWEEKGVLIPLRTEGNQRRYRLEDIQNFKKKKTPVVTPSITTAYNSDSAAPIEEPITKQVQPLPIIEDRLFVTPEETAPIEEPEIQKPSIFIPSEQSESRNLLPQTSIPYQRNEIPPLLSVGRDDVSEASVQVFKPSYASKMKALASNFQNTKSPAVFAGMLAIIVLIAGTLYFSNSSLQNPEILNQVQDDKVTSSNDNARGVLAAKAKGRSLVGDILFNIPAIFEGKVTINDEFEVNGKSLFTEDIKVADKNVDLGTGELTASNVVYGLTAGANITITGDPQNPTISAGLTGGVDSIQGQSGAIALAQGSGIGLDGLTITNTGVLSLGGQTGAVTLAGGTGIAVSGTSISNTDTGSAQNIFKNIIVDGTAAFSAGSNSDTLRFVAGTGITLTPDSGTNAITIDAAAAGSQWTTTGSNISYTTGNVGIGTGSPGRTLDVTGTARVTGGVTFSVFGAGVLHTDSSGVLSSSALNLAAGSTEVTGTLPVGNGGTGGTTFATNGVLYGNGTGALQSTSAPTPGQILLGNGSNIPTFTTLSGGATLTGTGVLSLVLPTSGTTLNTGSNSGLEFSTANGLSLLRGCANGEILKWNTGLGVWECSVDTGGSGSAGVVNVQNNEVAIGTSVDTLDFSTDFTLVASPLNEANISIADDILNFSEFADSLSLDSATNIALNNFDFTIGTNGGTGKVVIAPNAGGDAALIIDKQNTVGDIFTASASGTTRLTLTNAGNLNLTGGAYQIGGTTVLSGTALGSGVTTSSLTQVGALSSGSIASGFGTIATANTIQGSDITSTGTTGFTASGNGAGLTFSGSGNHLISASSGVLQLGGVTLTGAVTGNGQSITGLANLGTTGSVTFATFTSNGGILYTNASGQVQQVAAGSSTQVLKGGTTPSFGAVTLTTDVTGTLPAANGGTGFSTYTQGDLLYGNGSNTLSRLGLGGDGSVLTVSGGNPAWISSSSINFWQRSNGALSPLNSSDDFLLGSNATSSAKFAVTGIAGGTPTASISGSTANSGLYVNGDGTLATTNRQSLTIGSSSTGNIVLNGFGTGLIRSNAAGVLSSSAIDLSSIDVTNTLPVGRGGTGAVSFTSNGVIYGNATGALQVTAAGTDGQVFMGQSSGAPIFRTISGDATINSTTGVLTIASDAVALGTDTSGNYVATISSGNGISATATGEGSAPTIALGPLTAEWNQTGAFDITLNNAASELRILESAGDTFFATLDVGDLAADKTYVLPNFTGASADICLSTGNCAGAGGGLTGSGTNGQIAFFNGTSTLTSESGFFWDATNNKLGIGTDTPSGKFEVSGASTGQALAILNETGDQNILVGSASGTTRFAFDRSGNLNLTGGAYQIGGTSVLNSTTLGGNVVNSSLQTLGTISTGTWQGTAIAAQYGGTGDDTSGVTGVPYIAAGNWQYEAQLSAARGGTGANLSGANQGAIPYFSATGVMSALAPSTAGFVLTTNGAGANPTWTDAASLGTNYWNLANGVLSPKNAATTDLLLGSNATSSAKFAFINVNSGTPTASVSANDGNNATYLSGAGILGTTNAQSLTIGSSSTGNIVLDSGTGQITLADATTLTSALTVGGTTTLNGTTQFNGGFTLGDNGDTGSINTSDWDISTTGDLTGIGAITADGNISQTGATTFSTGTSAVSLNGDTTIQSDNSLTIAQLTTNGGVLYTNGTGGLVAQTAAGSAGQILRSSGGGAPTWVDASSVGTNFWQRNLGAVAPINITDDLLLGSTSTSSAKFAFTGVAGGTPTASISAGAGNNNTFLTGAGNLGTTNGQTLTLGGASTGNIVLDSGSGIITLADATALTSSLTVGGTTTLNGLFTLGDNGETGAINTSDWDISTSGDMSGIGSIAFDSTLTQTGTGLVTFTGNVDATNGLDVTNASLTVGGNATITTAGAISGTQLDIDGTIRLNGTTLSTVGAGNDLILDGIGGDVVSSNRFTIGSLTPGLSQFNVTGSQAGLALATLNETGGNDIFTASAAGTTRFTIANNGDLNATGAIAGLTGITSSGQIRFSGFSTNNGLIYTNGTGVLAQQATAGTDGQILVANGSGVPTWVTLGSDATISNNGTLTIANNAVALGTDTTGNYVANVTAGSGVAITGSAGEGWTPTFALGALTANWDQTGAFDIVLNNAGSELQILESTGGAFYGTVDVGDLTANRTYTLPDFDGTVCLSIGNCAGGAGGSKWQSNSSVLAPLTATDRVVLGGGTTTDFQFEVNGRRTGKALVSLNETGNQNILTASASGATVFNLTRTGTLQLLESTGGTFFGTLSVGDLAADKTFVLPNFTGSSADICLTTGNCAGAGGGLTGSGTIGQIAYFDATGNVTSETSGFAWDAANNKLGIGNDSPVAKLDVSGSVTGKSLMLLNETGGNDIFSASASGATRLTLSNSGNLNLSGGVYQANGASGITQGSPGCVTTTNGIVTGTGICQLGSEQWVVSNGTIYPGVTSLDLLLGGTATASAKFAVLNMAGGTPTATISANSGNNAAFLTGDGNLGTTNAQTLTLGGSSTGNIVLDSGSGIVRIADLPTNGIVYTTGSNGTLATEATLSSVRGGTGANLSAAAQGAIPYFSATGVMSALAPSTAGYVLRTNGANQDPTWVNASSLGTNYWDQANGALSPQNAGSFDLLLGSNATASAKFAFTNVSGGTPTASISAGTANNSLFLTGTGTIGTTNAQSLTLGGAATGNILLDSGSGSISLADATTLTSSLTVGGATTLNGSFTLGDNGDLGAINTSDWDISTSGDLTGIGAITADGNISQTGATTFSTGTGAVSLNGDTTIQSDNSLTIAQLTTNGGVLYTNGTGGLVAQTAAGSAGQILRSSGGGAPTWVDASSVGTNFWQRNLGAVAPLAVSDDLLLGSNATASAKFAFINVAGGTPTASISANSGNNALFITGNGTLGTTNAQTLTLGSASTGNVVIDSGNGQVSILDALTLAGNFTQGGSSTFTTGTGNVNINGNTTFGSGTTISQSGTGQVTFGGNIDANSGLDVAGNSLTVGGNATITTAGAISGTQLDVDGTLRLDGTTLSTLGASNDLTLDALGGNVIFGDADTLIIGGHAGNVAYNVISDAGGAPTSGQVASDNDLYIQGTIEAGALYQGANQVCDTSGNCAGTTNYLQLNSGNIAPGNAANVADRFVLGGNTTTPFQFEVNGRQTGKALVSLNETGNQDIFTASSAGTTRFTIANNGNLTATGTLTGLTGLSSSGTVTFSGVTANRALFTDGASNVTGSGTSTMLLNALTDETGTGVAVFGTSPTFTTSLVTGSTSFDLFNTTATTLNIGGAASATNLGASGGTLTLGAGGNYAITTGTNGNLSLTSAGSGNTTLGSDFNSSVFVGNATTPAPFSISGGIGNNAALIVNNVNSGNIIAASASGVTRFVVDNTGTITTGAYQGTAIGSAYGGTGDDTSGTTGVPYIAAGNWQYETALDETRGGTGNATYVTGDMLYASGNDTLARRAIGGAGQVLTVSGGLPTWVDPSTLSNSFWQRSLGAVSPTNLTDDLLLGSSATGSAKFAFFNVAGGTPTASISANSGANGTYLSGAGNLATTNAQTLTLGGASTGNIVLDSGSGLVSVADALTLAGNFTQSGATTFTTGTGQVTLAGNVNATNGLDVTNADLTVGGTNATITTAGVITGTTLNGTTGINTGAGAGTQRIDASGNLVGIGTIASTYLSTSANVVNLAASTELQFNGTAVINASRHLVNIAGVASHLNPTAANTYDLGTSASDQYREINGQTIYQNGSQVCDVTGNCSGLVATYWDQLNGALNAKNTTVDLLIGGTSTQSAKFAVLNVNPGSGTPTASLSGTTGGLYLTANGTLQTTNNQELNIGGNTTGNIILNSDGLSRVGIGTTTPTAELDVNGAASISGSLNFRNGASSIQATQNNSLSLGGATTGNIILNGDGNNFVGIGTTTPAANLDVRGTANIGDGTNYASFASDGDLQFAGNADYLVGANSFAFRYSVDQDMGLLFNTTNSRYDFLNPSANRIFSIGASTGSVYTAGAVGINAGTPVATLDVRSLVGTNPIASLSGQTASVGVVVDNSGTGDIFTASKSGASKFTILNNGNVQINNLSTGVVQSNASGLLSSSAIDLSSASFVTNTLGLTNGGTGLSINPATITDGQLLIGNDTANGFSLAGLTAGSGITITNGAGAITISQTGSGSSKWTQNDALGVLSPNMGTLDLLVGGATSASAKFGFLNVAGGTPTASISANSGNNASYLSGNGVLGTTNAQTLTLGSASTGNVSLAPGGAAALTALANGNVGIGTTSPTAKLDVVSTSGTGLAVTAATSGTGLSITGPTTGNGISLNTSSTTGNGIFMQTGSLTSGKGIALAAIISGAIPAFTGSDISVDMQRSYNQPSTINDTGNLLNLSRANSLTNASGIYILSGDVAKFSSNCTQTAGACIDTSSVLSLAQNYANASGPVLKIVNKSATASAIFIGSTEPGVGAQGKGFVEIQSSMGTLPAATISATTSFAGVVVDNNGTGDLFTASKSGASKFTVKNNGELVFNNYNTAGGVFYGTSTGTLGLSAQGSTGQCLTSNGSTAPSWATCSAGANLWQVNSGAISPSNSTYDVLFGGTASTSAKFAFLNNTGSGTPTASISGASNNALSLNATGVLGTTNAQTLQLGSAGTGNVVLAPNGSTALTALANGNVGIGTSSPANKFVVALGANEIAQFNNDPALSASGIWGTNIGFLSQNGEAQITTRGSSPLTFSTGGTINNMNQGTEWMRLDATGNLGIGTTTPLARLDVRGNSGTTPVASFSGSTTNAGLIVDNNGLGDLFTASKSGATKFVINNAGNVGIGSTTGTAKVNIVPNASQNALSIVNDTSGTEIQFTGAAAANIYQSAAQSLYLNSNAGAIQMGARGSGSTDLYIRGATVGNSLAGSVGIGPSNLTPLAALDVKVNAGTQPVASLSGATSFASLIVDQDGVGDLFTASKSGETKFVIKNNGDLRATNYNTAGGIFYGQADGTLALSAAGSTGQCLQSNASGAPTWGACDNAASVNAFTTTNGLIHNGNLTTDFAIGGNTSASAKFQVSVSGTRPTASISANTSYAGLVVDNDGLGDLFAASKSGATKFVIKNNGNVGIGTSNPVYPLEVSRNQSGFANIFIMNSTTTTSAGAALAAGESTTNFTQLLNLNNSHTPSGLFQPNRAMLRQHSQSGSNGLVLVTEQTAPIIFATGGTAASNERMRIDSSGTIGIGTTTPLATLDIRGISGTTPIASLSGSTTNAGLIVDNNGTGDLFTASKSGATKFTIMNNGSIRVNNLASCDTIDTDANGVLSCGTDAGGGATQNYWQYNNLGAISPFVDTADVLFGGTSTASAKFAFINNTGSGTPTASISAGSNNTAFLTGLGNLGTTNAQTLTLGGTSTGNIVLDSGSGLITLADNTTLSQNLTVAGTTGLTFSSTGGINLTGGTISDATDEVDINDDLAVSGILQVGGTGVTTYSRLGAATAGGANLGASNDLLVSGALEVDDLIYADGGIDTTFTQGSIVFAGANGVISENNANFFWDNTNSRLGIGANSNLLGTLDLRGTSGTLPVASVSGRTAAAGLVVDNSGTGDIFTASSSGLNRFVIKQDGNVGIGTNVPTSKLDVQGGRISQQGSAGYSGYMQTNSGNLASTTNLNPGILFGEIGGVGPFGADLGYNGGTSRQRARLFSGGSLSDIALGRMASNPTGQSDFTEYLTIRGDGGYIGIQEPSPTARLQITGTNDVTQLAIYGHSTQTNNLVELKNSAGLNRFVVAGGGNVGIGTGTNSLLGTLDVRGLSGTLPIASFSGQTSNAGLIVDNTGLGDLFTASKSGATKLTLTNAGNLNLAAGNFYQSGGISGITQGTASCVTTTAGIVTGSAACEIGLDSWTANASLGIVHTSNQTMDVLIGGVSSASAKVKFSPSGTAPTASISGLTSNAALLVDNRGRGDLFAASSSGLNRFVIKQNGNVGIGTTLPTSALDVNGRISTRGSLTGIDIYPADSSPTPFNLYSATGELTFYSSAIVGSLSTVGQLGLGINNNTPQAQLDILPFDYNLPAGLFSGSTGKATLVANQTANVGDIFAASKSGATKFVITNNGSVGVGTALPSATLDVRGNIGTTPFASFSGSTTNAAFILDNTGTGDLFTASKSGASKFVVKNSGDVGIGTTLPTAMLDVAGTASISSSLKFRTGTGVIQTTANNDLTIGGDTTGKVTLMPNNGAGIINLDVAASGGLQINGVAGADVTASCVTTSNGIVTGSATCQAGTEVWALNAGLLYNGNLTTDFAIGGATSASAKFKVSPSGTAPTASVSGLTSNAALLVDNRGNGDLFAASSSGLNRFVIKQNGNVGVGTTLPTAMLDVAGTASISSALTFRTGVAAIQTTANNTLTLGGATTGNIILSPLNNLGRIGINTTVPLAALDLRGSSGTTPVASISGQSSSAGLLVDNRGTGDLFAASSSGLNRFVIKQNGNIGIGTATPTSKLEIVDNKTNPADAYSSIRTVFTPTLTANSPNGFFAGNNIINSDANAFDYGTLSAQRNELNYYSDGNASNLYSSENYLTLDAQAVGSVSTINGVTSTIQNNSATNISFATGVNSTLTLAGSGSLSSYYGFNSTISNSSGTGANITDAYNFYAGGAGTSINGTIENLYGLYVSGTQGSVGLTNSIGLYVGGQVGGTGNNYAAIFEGGRIGMGTTTPLASLDLRGSGLNSGTVPVASISGQTAFAGLIVDNNGVGDLFSASKSGASKFTVRNNGDVVINNLNGQNGLIYGTQTTGVLAQATTSSSGLCLVSGASAPSWATCPSGSATSQWEIRNGLLYNGNLTTDFAVGGLSSEAAKFQVSLSGTRPTASVSGLTSNAALLVDNRGNGDLFAASSSGLNRFVIKQNGNVGVGTTLPTAMLDVAGTASISSALTFRTGVAAIQTTANNTLTLGGATTGNIILSPLNNLGRIGINTTVPLAALDLRGSSGTTPVASISGQSSSAGLIVDNNGVGDLFTASKSGKTLFTIQNSGVVKIGDNNSGLTFDYVNGGMTYLGNGRPTKQIVLSPEYAGGIITASGSATTDGDFTADASTSAALSLNGVTNNFLTYYEWSSLETTMQDYTVAVRVTLPPDFGSWRPGGAAMQIVYNTELSTVTSANDNKLDVTLIPEGQSNNSSAPAAYRQSQISSTNKIWKTVDISASDLTDSPDFATASRSAMLYLKMSSRNSNYVQIGDIIMNYLSKF